MMPNQEQNHLEVPNFFTYITKEGDTQRVIADEMKVNGTVVTFFVKGLDIVPAPRAVINLAPGESVGTV